MNPHLLRYDSAHVEFTIDTKRWYLMGSPLKGVVAGDMYTLRNGKQETNAFEEIKFNTTNNNRFAPAVYQRGWDKVQATVYDFNDETNTGSCEFIFMTWCGRESSRNSEKVKTSGTFYSCANTAHVINSSYQ